MYHEAVGVIYSGNSFCVTVPDHRRNCDFHQIVTAAKSCQTIGANLALMSTLDIDIGRYCPLGCRGATVLEILPLVSVLWSKSHGTAAIKFTNNGHRLQERIHDDADYEDNIKPTVSQMNSIFHAFCQADSLACLLYTSPSPRDGLLSRMPSSA